MPLYTGPTSPSAARESVDAPINNLTVVGKLSFGVTTLADDTPIAFGPIPTGVYMVFLAGMDPSITVAIRTMDQAESAAPAISTPDDQGSATALFPGSYSERVVVTADKPYMGVKTIGGTGTLFFNPVY